MEQKIHFTFIVRCLGTGTTLPHVSQLTYPLYTWKRQTESNVPGP